MNASHDPQSCSTCSCFPVQPAYNFYCHGKEITAVSLLLLRLPPFLCVSVILSTLTASLLHAPASISVTAAEAVSLPWLCPPEYCIHTGCS